MPRFVIERDLPSAGDLSHTDLQALAQKNCDVLKQLETPVQWVESFVTENKFYCIYISPSKAYIMHHAKVCGLPANRIEQIKAVINPVTAEALGEKL
jgi:hypothetical protein